MPGFFMDRHLVVIESSSTFLQLSTCETILVMKSWGFSRKVLGLFTISSLVVVCGLLFVLIQQHSLQKLNKYSSVIQVQTRTAQDMNRYSNLIASGQTSESNKLELQSSQSIFINNHRALLNGDKDLGITEISDEEFKKLLNDIDVVWSNYSSDLNMISQAKTANADALEKLSEDGSLLELSLLKFLMRLNQVVEEQEARIQYTIFAMIALLIAVFFVQLVFVGRLKKLLIGVLASFDDLRKEIVSSSNVIDKASHELNETATEQASAIHETSSAVTEVSKMINVTMENLAAGTDLAKEAASGANEGENKMESMTESVGRLKDSSNQLGELNEIIGQVKEKTEVINEIVSKTQLLSFNASIEAARAGQYGKGFSVVAAEVGKLAQLSGDSSNAIDRLLIDSSSQVDTIVTMLTEQVSEGAASTFEGVQKFQLVAASIRELSQLMQQISVATNEQKLGIDQCLEALKNLQSSAEAVRNRSHKLSNVTRESKEIRRKLASSYETLRRVTLGGETVKSKVGRPSAVTQIATSKKTSKEKSKTKIRRIG